MHEVLGRHLFTFNIVRNLIIITIVHDNDGLCACTVVDLRWLLWYGQKSFTNKCLKFYKQLWAASDRSVTKTQFTVSLFVKYTQF